MAKKKKPVLDERGRPERKLAKLYPEEMRAFRQAWELLENRCEMCDSFVPTLHDYHMLIGLGCGKCGKYIVPDFVEDHLKGESDA